MPLIPFPNVPAFPGVPPLVRQVLSAPTPLSAILLLADDPAAAGAVDAATWGIFDSDNNPVAAADSFVSFDHAKEWRISDFPIEQGGFQSYNKVETPFDQRVVLAKGGSEGDRADFLSAINFAVGSLDLYSVVTPEVTYINANLIGYRLSRASHKGVTLLMVELVIRQVRTSASTAFSKTASPAGASSQSGGTVQPKIPSAAEVAAVSGVR